MQPEQLAALFDRMAPSYDEQWAKMAPVRAALNLLTAAVLTGLRPDSRVLCVGVGTGAELIYLAERFPRWKFTAVEPAAGMLELCRARATESGILDRCTFHVGFLESLPMTEPYDAATCLLVSQFLVDRSVRSALFGKISEYLQPNGILVSSDLSADINSEAYGNLLELWSRVMAGIGAVPEVAKMREAYARGVAVLPAPEVQQIIVSGGFEVPVQFFQAGLLHAWYAQRATGSGRAIEF